MNLGHLTRQVLSCVSRHWVTLVITGSVKSPTFMLYNVCLYIRSLWEWSWTVPLNCTTWLCVIKMYNNVHHCVNKLAYQCFQPILLVIICEMTQIVLHQVMWHDKMLYQMWRSYLQPPIPDHWDHVSASFAPLSCHPTVLGDLRASGLESEKV